MRGTHNRHMILARLLIIERLHSDIAEELMNSMDLITKRSDDPWWESEECEEFLRWDLNIAKEELVRHEQRRAQNREMGPAVSVGS